MPLIPPARSDRPGALTSAARTGFHPLRVAAVTTLTPRAVAIDLAVPDDLRDEFTYTAGQYITIRAEVAGVDARRSYSLCTTPDVASATGLLRIGVARVEGGVLSTWLTREVRPGDDLRVASPRGDFALADTLLRPVVSGGDDHVHHAALCVGSGITPVLPLATTALARGDRVTLVVGSRDRESLMFAGELDTLARAHADTLTVRYVHSRTGADSDGRLDGVRLEHVITSLASPATVDHWYVCGPPAFVAGARSALAVGGAPATAVHHEEFATDATA